MQQTADAREHRRRTGNPRAMVHRVALVPLILAVGFGTDGCESGPIATERLRADSRVVLLDTDLGSSLNFDASTDLTDDRRLRAMVKFQNRASEPLYLLIQTLFKDIDGNIINDDAEWQVALVPENGIYPYEATTFYYEASDFIVRVRRGESY